MPSSVTQQTVQVSLASSWSGPLPPPESLQGYEAIRPGYADRIMDSAEAEGEHRRRLERRSQTFAFTMDAFGLTATSALCGWALWLGASLLAAGHQIGGFVTLVGALVPLAGALYIARRRKISART